MIKVLPRNLLRFVVLVLFQVLILNNIQISGYLNPYVYVLFILLLPFETPHWLMLVTAFLLGLSIDLFSQTPGIHAFATVFMAFFRPVVLNVLSPRDGYGSGSYPRIFYYGLEWFLKYSLTLIFIHHFVLFFMEVFRISGFFHTLLRVVASTVFSTLIVVISQYMVFKK
jgi:cell shape-determining protein MreD